MYKIVKIDLLRHHLYFQDNLICITDSMLIVKHWIKTYGVEYETN